MHQIKRILSWSKVDILLKQFNSNNICPSYINCIINLSKSYCTSSEKESVPIDDLKNLKFQNFKCDVEMWDKVLAEITKAKIGGKLPLPNTLNMNDIKELTELDSYRKRFKFLKFLFKKEKLKLADKVKKHKKNLEVKNATSRNVQNADHIEYGLGRNTLLVSCRNRTINKFYSKRLANSVIFGQKIVFDLGYDEFMWKRERRDCVSQLGLVYSINRQHKDPYDIHFCNANADSYCVQYLREHMPHIEESLISLTEKSYLDIFPKENLVYLSPHASESLKTYDHSAVYIIGAFVDTVKRDPISLQKSQTEGIKCYSLPLDDYILWGAGSKSLSINQAFSIMMAFRDTGDWKEALKHVPTRKIRRLEKDSEETEFLADKIFLLRN